jgi:hypothetical protein
MKNYLLLFLILGSLATLQAQHFLGGEIETRYVYGLPPLTAEIFIRVYREGGSEPREEIEFSWGDGTSEILSRISTLGFPGLSHLADTYSATHVYDTIGYMELSYLDSFLVSDVVNIPNSGEQYLQLRDTILIYDSLTAPLLGGGNTYLVYEGLRPASSAYGYDIEENGAFDLSLFFFSTLGLLQPYEGYLVPFYAPGATLPAATDSLVLINAHTMYWDRPVAPGKYGIRFHTRKFWPNENPIYQDENGMLDEVMLVSFSRQVIVNLTEDDIVNTENFNLSGEIPLSIYPNPATATTTLEYGGLNGEIYLKAINAQGQVMLQKTLNSTAQIQREAIDVSTWPAGVYWIELSNEQGQVMKKLVVE